jgi:hypothetical protein
MLKRNSINSCVSSASKEKPVACVLRREDILFSVSELHRKEISGVSS